MKDEYFDEKNRHVINVDLDGTLTNGENAWSIEPTPNQEHIDIINELYQNGYVIIIHTARPWDYASITVAWLIKYQVHFHGIFMFKGGSDYYLDDKSSSFEELRKLLDHNPQGFSNRTPICVDCRGTGYIIAGENHIKIKCPSCNDLFGILK